MKPLKRHLALIELSRDHYRLLSLCVRLLRIPAESHWAELEPHFPEPSEHFLEEEILFASYWLRTDNTLRECSETDHVKLRTMIAAPEYTSETRNENSVITLCDHAHFEEHKLFSAIEAYLNTSE